MLSLIGLCSVLLSVSADAVFSSHLPSVAVCLVLFLVFFLGGRRGLGGVPPQDASLIYAAKCTDWDARSRRNLSIP